MTVNGGHGGACDCYHSGQNSALSRIYFGEVNAPSDLEFPFLSNHAGPVDRFTADGEQLRARGQCERENKREGGSKKSSSFHFLSDWFKMFAFSLFSLLSLLAVHVDAHASFFHPSMYGFNVTGETFPYDNRPVAPLVDYTFDQWWFHGHLKHEPNAGDFFELPAGKPATTEIACDKGATSFFASSPGGDVRQGNNPCPNSPLAAIHSESIVHTHFFLSLKFFSQLLSVPFYTFYKK